ncbi:MAG: BCCT family transporter [Campylobacter sp.]|nr:BCCT family transporter [Campylobacter sp.]
MKFKHAFSPFVFYVSVALLFIILAFSLLYHDEALGIFKALQAYFTAKFGWFYVLGATIIFFAVMFLLFSRFGLIKLGSDHSTPKYSNASWFAMLFAAGMGIGIMFFGVAEPVMHYLAPPSAEAGSMEAAKEAMKITFFHWGLNAWAIYSAVAVVLAFFAFRHKLPLTLRSAFYPLVGDKIYGRFGDMVDVFAVIATLFGVATSLGFGVLQINAGFAHLFGFSMTVGMQIATIAIITLFVSISVSSGIDKGIKLLSNANMILAVFFVLFVLFLGNTTGILKDLVENTGNYLASFIGDTFNLYAYEKQNEAWLGGWTLFYWTWWISWSPFVGLFIAKISQGRTIREFITGALFVPTGFTIVWMSVFGNSAIELINGGFGELGRVSSENSSLAIFLFLEQFPLSNLLSGIALIMVVLFFITSADSAAMVMDMLCSRGKDATPKWQKIFWAVIIGLVASVLLYSGGLEALQSMTMLWALPLAVLILGSLFGLFRALRVDSEKKYTQDVANLPILSGSKSWKERLEAIINTPDYSEAKDFLKAVVKPAFSEICDEFIKNNLNAKIVENGSKIHIHIDHGSERDFVYGVRFIETSTPDYAMSDSYYRAEVYLLEGGRDYDVIGWSKQALINDVVEQYRKHMHFLHKTRG